jgi:DNA segregation ATPase FtsK/SpoIIIE-like protein
MTTKSKQIPPVVTLGLDLDELQQGEDVKISLSLERKANAHCCVIGASGSGKSYLLLAMLTKLILAEPHGEVIFANYKGDETFSFLEGCPRYFEHDSVFAALDIVHEHLCQKIAKVDMSETSVTFIFDEFVSAMISKQGEDKRNKTTIANQAMGYIAKILLQGRSCGNSTVRLWCFTQRPDSAVFTLGSKESFGTLVALSNISKEVKQMCFSDFKDDFDDDRRFGQGEGRVLLNNGAVLKHLKVPKIRDFERVKRICIDALSKPL